jgi:DNA-binding SARP family transcriptional activator
VHSHAASEPEVVRIGLLGGFWVSIGSRVIAENQWRLRKASNLIKLLALCPGHQLHREQAMDLLWPNLDPKAAANNLYYALHHARRTLQPAGRPASSRHLLLRGEQLMLFPEGPVWVDAESFEEASAAARRAREPSAYRAALDLYAGELLPQDRYEEWAQERREELRRVSWS